VLRADGVNAKTGSSGFYREDAARLASEAARLPQPPLEAPQPARGAQRAAAPAVLLDEPQRPPLMPEPAMNQNERPQAPQFAGLDADDDDRRSGLARVVAWVLLAPLYSATLVGSVGLNVMFIRGLLRI
jgi:hypothetical protein